MSTGVLTEDEFRDRLLKVERTHLTSKLASGRRVATIGAAQAKQELVAHDLLLREQSDFADQLFLLACAAMHMPPDHGNAEHHVIEWLSDQDYDWRTGEPPVRDFEDDAEDDTYGDEE